MDTNHFSLTRNHYFASPLLLAVAFLLPQSSAAAPAAFCQKYAEIAVQQYNAAVAHKMPGIGPPAWSNDFNGHKTWCLLPFITEHVANQETTNRQIALDKHRYSKKADIKESGATMGTVAPGAVPKQKAPFTPNLGGLLAKPSTAKAVSTKTYTVICQGKINPSFAVNQRGASGLELIYRFNRSKRSATEGLRSGECAWLDRGIHPNEPSTLLIPLNQLDSNVAGWNISSRYGGYKLKALTTNGVFLDVHTISSNGTTRKHAVSALFDGNNKPLIMQAYNNGEHLVVTRTGP